MGGTPIHPNLISQMPSPLMDVKSSSKVFQLIQTGSQYYKMVQMPLHKHLYYREQEESDTSTCLCGYDSTGITETWWDGSYYYSIDMEGFLGKKGQGDEEGDNSLCQ